ncbi:hypothetical protein U1Q18_033851 [Sarracenia purpurea var. burkii]
MHVVDRVLQVDNISGRSAIEGMIDWATIISDVIQKFSQPVCMGWLEKELCLEGIESDKELLSIMVEKLMEDDTTIQNIRKSGKEGLYAELIQFLIFGYRR